MNIKRKNHDMKPMPPISYLNEYFEYREGALYCKERPASHPFKDERMRASWNGRMAGKKAGGQMRHGYRLVGVDGERFLEHRLIYHLLNGPLLPTEYVDHIDHDHTNNRIENLRVCSHSENLWNQPGRKSKYGPLPKHVHWNKNERKYKVTMRTRGKVHHIGTFADLKEATAAASRARAQLHGPFQNSEAAS